MVTTSTTTTNSHHDCRLRTGGGRVPNTILVLMALGLIVVVVVLENPFTTKRTTTTTTTTTTLKETTLHQPATRTNKNVVPLVVPPSVNKVATVQYDPAVRFQVTRRFTTTRMASIRATWDKKKKRPVLEIVTAFSDNHVLEAVNCLKTLIQVGFQGPLTIYYLKQSRNEPISEAFQALRNQVYQSPLHATILEYVVSPRSSNYTTYCFKPEVIEYHLMHTTLPSKVLMWMDASTRFVSDEDLFVRENPEYGARRMLDNGITFVGLLAPYLGMGESTHNATWQYLNRSHIDYCHLHEIAATHFLINLLRRDFLHHVLEPWLDCGVRHCNECMSPPGSSKAIVGKIHGPNSTQIITHRQDQSVLSILVYDWMIRYRGKIELGQYHYGSDKLRVDVKWDDRVPYVDLIGNMTDPPP